MNDFKLKLVLASLTGLIFSFIFILLAFVLPSREKQAFDKTPKNKLEKISNILRKNAN